MLLDSPQLQEFAARHKFSLLSEQEYQNQFEYLRISDQDRQQADKEYAELQGSVVSALSCALAKVRHNLNHYGINPNYIPLAVDMMSLWMVLGVLRNKALHSEHTEDDASYIVQYARMTNLLPNVGDTSYDLTPFYFEPVKKLLSTAEAEELFTRYFSWAWQDMQAAMAADADAAAADAAVAESWLQSYMAKPLAVQPSFTDNKLLDRLSVLEISHKQVIVRETDQLQDLVQGLRGYKGSLLLKLADDRFMPDEQLKMCEVLLKKKTHKDTLVARRTDGFATDGYSIYFMPAEWFNLSAFHFEDAAFKRFKYVMAFMDKGEESFIDYDKVEMTPKEIEEDYHEPDVLHDPVDMEKLRAHTTFYATRSLIRRVNDIIGALHWDAMRFFSMNYGMSTILDSECESKGKALSGCEEVAEKIIAYTSNLISDPSVSAEDKNKLVQWIESTSVYDKFLLTANYFLALAEKLELAPAAVAETTSQAKAAPKATAKAKSTTTKAKAAPKATAKAKSTATKAKAATKATTKAKSAATEGESKAAPKATTKAKSTATKAKAAPKAKTSKAKAATKAD